MAHWFFKFFMLAAVAVDASYSYAGCEDELQPVKAIASHPGVVRSYLSLIDLYLASRPQALQSIVEPILKSNEFLNPFERDKDRLKQQVSSGIEALRSRFSVESWQHLKIAMQSSYKEKLEIQNSKNVSAKETSYVYGPTVISKNALGSVHSGPVHFTQNDRSFVIVSTDGKKLLLYEIINDQLIWIKNFNTPFEGLEVKIASDQNRVFVILKSPWVPSKYEFINKFYHFYGFAVMELKDLELIPLAEHYYKDEFNLHDAWVERGELNILLNASHNMQILRLKKRLFGSGYKFKSLEGFDKFNASIEVPVRFRKNGELFLAYERISYIKDEKINDFVIQKISDHFNQNDIKVLSDFYMTHPPVVFNQSGQDYMALGGFKIEEDDWNVDHSYIQIYRLDDNQNMHLAFEEKFESGMSGIHYLSGLNSLLVLAGNNITRYDFKNGAFSQTMKFDGGGFLNKDSEIIKVADRYFLNLASASPINKPKPNFRTFEFNESGMNEMAHIGFTNFTAVPSQADPEITLMCAVKFGYVYLVRIIKSVSRP